MATLLLTGLGTLIGGPLGGALGALAGQQIDHALIGSKTRQGSRLKELSVQASSYGAAIPRVYGRMRIAGTVVWATDLTEHREKSGGGKGRPKTVTYSYTSSFAVALSSRPILGIGRIWADGSLLRGSEGDLKVPGTLRVHRGYGDQAPDLLLAAAEGADTCPALRGCAYAVFEDLQLADFGNRIPSLSFEVLADDGELAVSSIVADLLPEANIELLAHPVLGFSVDGGSAGSALETIAAVLPLNCITSGEGLRVSPSELADVVPALLPEPLLAGSDESGPASGFQRRREPLPRPRLTALRYYDIDRDYQPGVQQGRGRAVPGDIATVDFPAVLTAAAAVEFADAASHRAARPQETATYRIAQVDEALAPGSVVRMLESAECWRVEEWEWTGEGVELTLRALPHAFRGQAVMAADPGRANNAADLAATSTQVAAFELPCDGMGTGSSPALFVAASSARAGWKGAALHALHADGSLVPIGVTGRTRALLGTASTALEPGSPLTIDRANTVDVVLAATDLDLAEASLAQLASGANRALLGSEIIQFARAEPLGGGRWRLADLLRGRGGTETAVFGHVAGERFVLLDDALVPLDPQAVGDAAYVRIAAIGLADPEPVVVAFDLAGVTSRPLSPVHGSMRKVGGGIQLAWTRRARGAWAWPDGVDAPLSEESESYVVTLGELAAPIATWEITDPKLSLIAEEIATLRQVGRNANFAVRQRGSQALSEALVLGQLD